MCTKHNCKNRSRKGGKGLLAILLTVVILMGMNSCGLQSDSDLFNQQSNNSRPEHSQPTSHNDDDNSGNDPLAGLISGQPSSSEPSSSSEQSSSQPSSDKPSSEQSSGKKPESSKPSSEDSDRYENVGSDRNPNVTNSIGEYKSSEKSEILRLVNFYNRLPSDFSPAITEINGGKSFNVKAAEALDQMIADCNEAMGKTRLWAQSTYRSYSKQTKLYENEVKKWEDRGMSRKEAENKAATIVAIPGTSEHNTGLCCDFNTVSSDFADTEMYTWLIEHCHEYGFVERYPKNKQDITGIIWEPWHYRYVGVEAATEMKQNGWCLEEYHYYKGL